MNPIHFLLPARGLRATGAARNPFLAYPEALGGIGRVRLRALIVAGWLALAGLSFSLLGSLPRTILSTRFEDRMEAVIPPGGVSELRFRRLPMPAPPMLERTLSANEPFFLFAYLAIQFQLLLHDRSRPLKTATRARLEEWALTRLGTRELWLHPWIAIGRWGALAAAFAAALAARRAWDWPAPRVDDAEVRFRFWAIHLALTLGFAWLGARAQFGIEWALFAGGRLRFARATTGMLLSLGFAALAVAAAGEAVRRSPYWGVVPIDTQLPRFPFHNPLESLLRDATAATPGEAIAGLAIRGGAMFLAGAAALWFAGWALAPDAPRVLSRRGEGSGPRR